MDEQVSMLQLRAILRSAGFDPRRLLSAARGWRRYAADKKRFLNLATRHEMPWGRELPILTEWDDSSGSLGSYFYQDLAVARWVMEHSPARHVDVGSRIDGFIGHLAVFREVEVIDIRPQPFAVRNVRFHQLDLMLPLPDEWIECTDSLSCLHTIEHFGLGRYGDALDAEGHLKGLTQLKRMVRRGGTLYLSTPIGCERIEFNAHRIFSPATLLEWFGSGWNIEHSAVVDDATTLESPDDSPLRSYTGDLAVGIIAAKKVAE